MSYTYFYFEVTAQCFTRFGSSHLLYLDIVSLQDALQEHYHKEGTFPGPTITPPRRLWTLLNFLFWAALLLSPLINFACGVVVSGSPLLILGFSLFLIVGE